MLNLKCKNNKLNALNFYILHLIFIFYIPLQFFNTSRLITSFCISLVPSPMVHSLESR
ncbi:MAG: hypothetical protein JWM28_3443 [Chitinophagaceae bacterium]|nr:hypothetical protein [Chitinophagaceae bacterium]